MPTCSLEGDWQFRCPHPLRGEAPRGLQLDRWMKAVMPGTVHYQLQKLGKIPDPVPRPQRARGAVDRRSGLGASRTIGVTARGLRPYAPGAGLRRHRHRRHHLPQRPRGRALRQHVPPGGRATCAACCAPATTSCACSSRAPRATRDAEAERGKHRRRHARRFPLADRRGRAPPTAPGSARCSAISAGTGASTWRPAGSGNPCGSNAPMPRASRRSRWRRHHRRPGRRARRERRVRAVDLRVEVETVTARGAARRADGAHRRPGTSASPCRPRTRRDCVRRTCDPDHRATRAVVAGRRRRQPLYELETRFWQDEAGRAASQLVPQASACAPLELVTEPDREPRRQAGVASSSASMAAPSTPRAPTGSRPTSSSIAARRPSTATCSAAWSRRT